MKIVNWLFGAKCAACGQRSKSIKHQASASPGPRLLCNPCNAKVQQEQRMLAEEQRRKEEETRHREVEVRGREENEKQRMSFLVTLSHDEKLAVSNLNPMIYGAIIKEKKGEDAPQVMTDAPSLVQILDKLSVS